MSLSTLLLFSRWQCPNNCVIASTTQRWIEMTATNGQYILFFLILSFDFHSTRCSCVWCTDSNTQTVCISIYCCTVCVSVSFYGRTYTFFRIPLFIPFHCVHPNWFLCQISFYCSIPSRKFNWISTQIKKLNVVNCVSTWIWMQYYCNTIWLDDWLPKSNLIPY